MVTDQCQPTTNAADNRLMLTDVPTNLQIHWLESNFVGEKFSSIFSPLMLEMGILHAIESSCSSMRDHVSYILSWQKAIVTSGASKKQYNYALYTSSQ